MSKNRDNQSATVSNTQLRTNPRKKLNIAMLGAAVIIGTIKSIFLGMNRFKKDMKLLEKTKKPLVRGAVA